MATIWTHAVKPPIIPRVRRGVKGGIVDGVTAMVGEAHVRCSVAHVTSHHLLAILLLIPVMTLCLVHPALPCIHHTTVMNSMAVAKRYIIRKYWHAALRINHSQATQWKPA